MKILILALALGCTLAEPAWADACKTQLAELASLDMVPVAGRMAVPITINGAPKMFLVATAAGATSLTKEAGASLGLAPIYSDTLRFLDANGYAARRYFDLKTVRIGILHGADLNILTTPDPSFGQAPPLDGILAADLMGYYDIEIDFAARKLNIFSSDHCPGGEVYWQAAAAGEADITLAQRQQDQARGGRLSDPDPGILDQLEASGMDVPLFTPPLLGTDIRTTVMLDGKRFSANIDTGALTSTLNTDTARAVYDVTADSPGSAPVEAPAPDGKPGVETVVVQGTHIFVHTFHTLSFGGVTVNNPHFTVRPDTTGAHDPDNDYRTGSHVMRVDDFPRPEITIGMDILSKLHLYFAFKEGKLYLTPAAPQPKTPA